MEKKNNVFALSSLCLSLGNIVLFILLATFGFELTIIELICLVICLAAFVLGIVGVVQINKDEMQKGKGMAIAGIVLGVLGVLFFGLGFLGTKMLNDPEFAKQFCVQESLVSKCTDNGDGTASCLYVESANITCNSSDLKESQFKK